MPKGVYKRKGGTPVIKDTTFEDRLSYFEELPQQLFRWGQSQGWTCFVEEYYFLLTSPESFNVMFSRRGEMIQCYYTGYGHLTEERYSLIFPDLEKILAFIEEAKSMETFPPAEDIELN